MRLRRRMRGPTSSARYPEGDFDPEEIQHFGTAGFTPGTFGEHRLRTETAALYAVQAFHILNAS